MDDGGLDDPYLPLAFSLFSSPGAYAVIAGAGVSVGAGVKTAWGMVVEIAQRICRADGKPVEAESITAQTVEIWWQGRFNTPLTYSGILERVAPAQYERERVLRGFFDPMPAPSAGHRAIARLAEAGVIRVIVTMNFDHLFEKALQDVGLQPRVVATDGEVAGLPPLHTITDPIVVHLHGSYLDGASMLNTSTELAEYSSHRQALIGAIVSTHGLLIAGWSAQHDKALRETLQAKHRKFYTPGWINPTSPDGEAHVIAKSLGAHVIEATADAAFTRLADAVDAMNARNTRHSMTAAVVTDRIKQDLAGQRPAITAHDTFNSEAARLETVDALRGINYSTITTEDLDRRVVAIDEACLVPAAATAVLARWGNEETDEWWMRVLEQWSSATPHVGGSARVDELPLIVATNLFYAVGIGVLAGRRYQLLARLFVHQTETSLRTKRRACQALPWDIRHCDVKRATTNPAREKLAGTLAEALGLSTSQVDRLWQQFETLLTAARIMSAPSVHNRMEALTAARAQLDDRRRTESTGTIVHSPVTGRDLAEAADKELANLGRLAGDRRPHVEVEQVRRSDELNEWPWISPVAENMSQSANSDVLDALAAIAHRDSTTDHMPASQFLTTAQTVLQATVVAFHLTAVEIQASRTLSRLWLDAPGSPQAASRH